MFYVFVGIHFLLVLWQSGCDILGLFILKNNKLSSVCHILEIEKKSVFVYVLVCVCVCVHPSAQHFCCMNPLYLCQGRPLTFSCDICIYYWRLLPSQTYNYNAHTEVQFCVQSLMGNSVYWQAVVEGVKLMKWGYCTPTHFLRAKVFL